MHIRCSALTVPSAIFLSCDVFVLQQILGSQLHYYGKALSGSVDKYYHLRSNIGKDRFLPDSFQWEYKEKCNKSVKTVHD